MEKILMNTIDETTPNKSRRKRGAQPGNSNHLKHGLYAHPPLPFEIKDSSRIPVTDLSAEISTYKEFILAYGRAALPDASTDLEAARKTLLALAYAANQLATLTRFQYHAQLYTASSQSLEKWVASLPFPADESQDIP
jgi:hypothetical protein